VLLLWHDVYHVFGLFGSRQRLIRDGRVTNIRVRKSNARPARSLGGLAWSKFIGRVSGHQFEIEG
jgi:hypothetical protein